jgi:hypothetical protein
MTTTPSEDLRLIAIEARIDALISETRNLALNVGLLDGAVQKILTAMATAATLPAPALSTAAEPSTATVETR